MTECLLADPVMADLVHRHLQPAFPPQQPFHSLVDAIVSQQISGKAAASIMRQLKQLVPIRPVTLAQADLRRLRRAGLSRAIKERRQSADNHSHGYDEDRTWLLRRQGVLP